MNKRAIILFLIFLILLILLILFLFQFNKKNENKVDVTKSEETIYNSNIIQNVSYFSKDNKGNEYKINSLYGEIDYSNNEIIFLTKVKAQILLKNKKKILITSDFGKYNTSNFDTIFSKNVKINYLDNKITGEYLDLSMARNSLIISKNVIYTNNDDILNADVIEVEIDTKDTRIFMYDNKKKVNIRNK